MKQLLTSILFSIILSGVQPAHSQEVLIYHPIQTDSKGHIIPWFDKDPGKSYNHVMKLVFNFWDTMRKDMNGLPYYMNHQVWKPRFNDPRGIGGDQVSMALSSWNLYYDYTGDERVKANMYFMADYYLSHSLSPANCLWPNIPFPYNTLTYSGIYDGDMRNGRGVTQPDKAGSLGLELIHLYKKSAGFFIGENQLYLSSAINIANTLAANIKEGNKNYSPMPFKVDVHTGRIPLYRDYDLTGTWIDSTGYTSNWAPTMQLFLDLIAMKQGDTSAYRKGFETLLSWMKAYPMKLNKWGPFFEDVDAWSETQINAMTFARFIMEHREYFSDWKNDVAKIIRWSQKTFGNNSWEKYGVRVTNEQTYYQTPAQSHSARQAADELLFVSLQEDKNLYENALRQLHWATYMVDHDGKNRFPQDEHWLTDGYGDYIRHFLRAMDAFPSLAPAHENHIISSTSVINQADYEGNFKKFFDVQFKNVDTSTVSLFYRTYDVHGTEKIRMKKKPTSVLLDYKPLKENKTGEGFEWKAMESGGLLTVRREKGKTILVLK